MGLLGGFALAGAIGGLGAGITNRAAQRREEALSRQKREEVLADREVAFEREDAKDEKDAELKVGLLTLANQYKREEGETEFNYKVRLAGIQADLESKQIGQRAVEERKTAGYKAVLDKDVAGYTSSLRTSEDRESKDHAASIARGEAKVVGTTPEGFIVLQKGNTLITTRTKSVGKSGGGESGGSEVAALVEARKNGGVTPAATTPKPAAAPAPKKWTKNGQGQYVIGTEAAAEEFTSDPRNRGKTFIYNGKPYTVK